MQQITQEDRQVTKNSSYVGNIYFNGFEITFSNSDASIELRRNSEVIANLNLSFETLKTLSEMLPELVNDIETNVGHIHSIKEFQEKMESSLKKALQEDESNEK